MEGKLPGKIRGHTQKYNSCMKIFYTILFHYFVFLQHFNREKIQSFNLIRRLYRRFIAKNICSRHEIYYRCYGSFFTIVLF